MKLPLTYNTMDTYPASATIYDADSRLVGTMSEDDAKRVLAALGVAERLAACRNWNHDDDHSARRDYDSIAATAVALFAA